MSKRLVAVEPTPGLYVSSFVPEGAAYKLNATAFGIEPMGDGQFAFAISYADWLKIQGPDLERMLDELTRRYAEHGLRGVQRWLDGLRPQQQLWSDE